MPTSTSEPTLALALDLDGNPIRKELASWAKQCIEFDAKERLGATLAPGFWGALGREAEQVVATRLAETPIARILVGAWVKAKEFESFADPKVHPPGEPSTATLVKHTIVSPHTIEVDLVVAGRKVQTVKLDFEIELELEGIHLRILDGRIRAISAGIIRAMGTLECEGKKLKSFPLREIVLEKELVLENPLPIMLPDRYPGVALPAGAKVPGGGVPTRP